jgi:hypothetical protein
MKKSILFGSLAALSLLFAGHSASAQGAIVDGGTYKLTHYDRVDPATKTPLCLDVDGASTEAAAGIGQWLDNGNDAQRFVFEKQTDGSYKLRHKGTQLYVQPIGLSPAVNTKIEQNVSSESLSQRWVVSDPGNNGRYKFILKSTESLPLPQALEVGFGSDAPGARVNLFDDNGFEPAQRWLLTLMSSPTATKNADKSVLNAEAYPNPFGAGQRLTMRVETIRSGTANVDVLDMLGHKVYSQRAMLNSGTNMLALGNQQLAAGVYVVRVSQGELIQQTRVVQQ